MCKWWVPSSPRRDPPVPAELRPRRLYDRGLMEQRLRDVLGFQIR